MFSKKATAVARLSLTALCSALLAAAGRAQDGEPGARVRCVDLRRIDHTEIVDDRTILFHMTDRKLYQNRLSHACPGLLRGEPFMYRVRTMQLCDTDVLTVLERWGFGGFTPMEACSLGRFTSIEPAEAEALRAAAKAREDRSKN